MSVVVEFTLRSPDAVLYETLTSFPDVRIEIESLDGLDPHQPVAVMWVNGEDLDGFDDAVREDETVGDLRLLDELDGRRLYRFQFTENVGVVFYPVFLEQGASLLTLACQDGTWSVRIRFPNREALSEFREFCVDTGGTFRLERVCDEPYENTDPLTERQREAVVVAYTAGYFEVPRDASLETVAEELGVSQQAASERLRRAMRHLAARTVEQ
jgi:predicted DNA binding protein